MPRSNPERFCWFARFFVGLGMSKPVYFLSEAAETRLCERLVVLEHDLAAAQEAVVVSREAGDIAENTDFLMALTERGSIEAEVARIRDRLKHRVAVETGQEDVSVVRVGSVVSLRFDTGSLTERFLVGDIHESVEGAVGLVTPDSPLGAVLLGAGPGDEVSFQAAGNDVVVTVEKIESTV